MREERKGFRFVAVIRFTLLFALVTSCASLLHTSTEKILPPLAAYVLTSLVMLVAFVYAATKVGYSATQAVVFSWIPVYGAVFGIKVLWRLANTPDKYRSRNVRRMPRTSVDRPTPRRPIVPPAEMKD